MKKIIFFFISTFLCNTLFSRHIQKKINHLKRKKGLTATQEKKAAGIIKRERRHLKPIRRNTKQKEQIKNDIKAIRYEQNNLTNANFEKSIGRILYLQKSFMSMLKAISTHFFAARAGRNYSFLSLAEVINIEDNNQKLLEFKEILKLTKNFFSKIQEFHQELTNNLSDLSQKERGAIQNTSKQILLDMQIALKHKKVDETISFLEENTKNIKIDKGINTKIKMVEAAIDYKVARSIKNGMDEICRILDLKKKHII